MQRDGSCTLATISEAGEVSDSFVMYARDFLVDRAQRMSEVECAALTVDDAREVLLVLQESLEALEGEPDGNEKWREGVRRSFGRFGPRCTGMTS